MNVTKLPHLNVGHLGITVDSASNAGLPAQAFNKQPLAHISEPKLLGIREPDNKDTCRGQNLCNNCYPGEDFCSH